MSLLLSDMQYWLNELVTHCVHSLHPPGVKLLTGRNYRMSITVFAHIIERHYYKTMRHPGTGKFDIPLGQVLDYIKEAGLSEPVEMKGNTNFKRSLPLKHPIGITRKGDAAYTLVVITDSTGNIVTAFPE